MAEGKSNEIRQFAYNLVSDACLLGMENAELNAGDLERYDPTLDPHSPQFDTAAWRAAVEKYGLARMNARVRQNIAKGIAEAIEREERNIYGLLSLEREGSLLFGLLTLDEIKANFLTDDLAESIRLWEELRPYMDAEIDADPDILERPMEELLNKAAARARADGKALPQLKTEIAPTGDEPPRFTAKAADLLLYPVDKVNYNIWNMLESDEGGKLALEIDTSNSRRRKREPAIIDYAISFEELEADARITKQLTPFDKRVYIAAAALYNAGNDVVSVSQLFRAMGNTGTPAPNQIERINDSLTKMGAARVYLDNTREKKVNKRYPTIKYDAPLLPFERKSVYINNTLTESAIHFFREPPLITFARERKQVTTIPAKLLESPISKTDANLRLDNYLLERIAQMKRPNSTAPRKILFSTIYDNCGITDKKQRQRTREKIQKYLDHYQACGWIKSHAAGADGITVQP